jgi:DNA-binding NarL/FixJ family response regulator
VIAILLVALPRLLREQVEAAIDAEPDLEIVAERDDSSELEEALRSTGARVVVAAEYALEPARALALVASSGIRVITLSGDGRDASVYECRPEQRSVGELSPQALAELLRTTPVESP